MRGKLIIEGNSVYEIDEECLKRKLRGEECEKEKEARKDRNARTSGIKR